MCRYKYNCILEFMTENEITLYIVSLKEKSSSPKATIFRRYNQYGFSDVSRTGENLPQAVELDPRTNA